MANCSREKEYFIDRGYLILVTLLLHLFLALEGIKKDKRIDFDEEPSIFFFTTNFECVEFLQEKLYTMFNLNIL